MSNSLLSWSYALPGESALIGEGTTWAEGPAVSVLASVTLADNKERARLLELRSPTSVAYQVRIGIPFQYPDRLVEELGADRTEAEAEFRRRYVDGNHGA